MPDPSELMTRLGLANPVIQAPMAGAGTPALASAASRAGSLGSLGAALMPPDAIRQAIQETRRATDRLFSINLLLVAPPLIDPARIERMRARLRPHFERLGIDPAGIPPPSPPPFGFADQLEVVVEERVPVFSFAFGIPGAAAIARLKAAGTFVIGAATSVTEARQLAAAGVDAVVAQGLEAGGHRATFAHSFDDGMIPLPSLVGEIVGAIDLPVIASGGLSDARQIARIMDLGAQAVQIGTLFLACAETAIPGAYRSRVLKGGETVITRAYTGRPARALRTAFTDDLDGDAEIPDFPVQAMLTAPLREAAAERGDAFSEYLPMLAGTGVGHGTAGPAADVLDRLTGRR
ncbi:Putative monooxygenase [Defluviimonas aquaemixtae]|uniref:Propionate 3-nitronate monooxygenase n=1 Tax=Albidovulum aquaemixtae TaxID=1542388 RepID=A0A2R8B3J4_9RHOB|nr:nitronate monooxygenase [Defluviimonas aquaemixtae]SPH17165.1 Putative monooxygenase [Defluviimonas aquaemixtae]